jgi:hypothetical protein
MSNDLPPGEAHGERTLVLDAARYAVTIDVGRHVIIADEPEALGVSQGFALGAVAVRESAEPVFPYRIMRARHVPLSN